ncbi:MAG: hydroxymethylbilane synthase [Treponema sp.]|jgi:hydroxymethylbilane synthase|nr:hydroxymethylbilane synthase [Treponema sp.]
MFSKNNHEKRVFRAGSRGSDLALAQTELFIRRITGTGCNAIQGAEFAICPIKTSGDMIQDRSLDEIGGKGLFIRELDRALLDGEIDFAVHSLKDMPMQITGGLEIAAFSEREDPRDVLVLPKGAAAPDMAKPIGCSGKRRSFQLSAIFSDTWKTALVRGNVLTRLEKLDRGEYGALVLAAAGLKRLGLSARISRFFEPAEMLPAAGQGIMCIVTRNEGASGFVRAADCAESALCAAAERAFVRALGGDCSSPIGAFAEMQGDTLTLNGLYYAVNTDPQTAIRGSIRGDKSRAENLGRELAKELLGS